MRLVATDQRFTPKRALDVVREFAGGEIALDPCTTPDNPTQARLFFALPDHDGLVMSWAQAARTGTVFVNCPYSRGQIAKWMAKCVWESAEAPWLDIIPLIPSDLGTTGGKIVAEHADALCFVGGRLAFGSPEGASGRGAKQPSIIPYFGERTGRFERIFNKIGNVWVR